MKFDYFRMESILNSLRLIILSHRLLILHFCGNLSYFPNLKAVTYLIEKILPLNDQLSLVIAGAEMTSEIQEIRHQQVSILGHVKDIRSVYGAAKMLVAPIMDGAGQQNKIIEAMAMSIPCVTTSFVKCWYSSAS